MLTEERKVTVVSTKDHTRKTFMSRAETLSEFKDELREHNIDYGGLSFIEGRSKTELVSDSSTLPVNTEYISPETGERVVTNELVFLLTNPSKKIKSGVSERLNVYRLIKSGGYADEIRKRFGKIYTQVSTAELEKFIDAKLTGDDVWKEEEKAVDCPDRTGEKIVSALRMLVCALYENDYLSEEECDSIMGGLGGWTAQVCGDDGYAEAPGSLESGVSDKEIDDMLADIG